MPQGEFSRRAGHDDLTMVIYGLDNLAKAVEELKRAVEEDAASAKLTSDRVYAVEASLPVVQDNVTQLLQLMRDGNRPVLNRLDQIEVAVAQTRRLRRVIRRRFARIEKTLKNQGSAENISRRRLVSAVVAGIVTAAGALGAIAAAWPQLFK